MLEISEEGLKKLRDAVSDMNWKIHPTSDPRGGELSKDTVVNFVDTVEFVIKSCVTENKE